VKNKKIVCRIVDCVKQKLLKFHVSFVDNTNRKSNMTKWRLDAPLINDWVIS